MEEKLNAILSKLDEMDKAQSNTALRTARIERVLIGDESYKQNGIIHDVAEAKEYINKDKINKAKQTGIVIGVSAASGGLVAWLKSLFS